MKTSSIIAGLTLGLAAGMVVLAQQTGDQVPQRAQPSTSPQHQTHPVRHQVMPIIAALDADRNGEISAEEIANASAALLTLDANNDGKLTPDEFLPPVPAGFREVRHQAEPITHSPAK
jgi:hypothetical protein